MSIMPLKSRTVKARIDAVSTALLLLAETIAITETRVFEEAHSGLVPVTTARESKTGRLHICWSSLPQIPQSKLAFLISLGMNIRGRSANLLGPAQQTRGRE